MVKKPEVLAIIPARGGSKGIPRKNIKSFAGYPLIAYSILAALRAESVTRVIVSTDDDDIARVAREWGAEVPFMRPAELAQDKTTDYPVMRHALDWLKENEVYQPEVVVQLRPTSPVRPLALVDDAVKALLAHPQADCVRGVVPSGQNPYKMWTVDEASGAMKPLLQVEGIQEPYNAPRQILPATYWQTGHIDAIRLETILEKESLTGDVLYPIHIDPKFTVDIDLPRDWHGAEATLKALTGEVVDPASNRRAFPKQPKFLVMDFDGVFTDNRVIVDQNGVESVRADRSDGLGFGLLKAQTPVECLIISKERNPVVAQRAAKLGIPVLQAVDDKATALKNAMRERNLAQEETIFVGNDVNDLPTLDIAGYFVAPADSHSEVLRRADLVLKNKGSSSTAVLVPTTIHFASRSPALLAFSTASGLYTT